MKRREETRRGDEQGKQVRREKKQREENMKDRVEKRLLFWLFDILYEFYMSRVVTAMQLPWPWVCDPQIDCQLVAPRGTNNTHRYLLSFIQVKAAVTSADAESRPPHDKASAASSPAQP